MKKERLSIVVFLINGILFLLGGLGLLDEGKALFGAIQIAAGIFNIALFIGAKNGRRRHGLNLIILFMNVVVACSVAWDYTLAGKQYIQYAWYLAAMMSLVAFFIQLIKGRSFDQ